MAINSTQIKLFRARLVNWTNNQQNSFEEGRRLIEWAKKLDYFNSPEFTGSVRKLEIAEMFTMLTRQKELVMENQYNIIIPQSYIDGSPQNLEIGSVPQVATGIAIAAQLNIADE